MREVAPGVWRRLFTPASSRHRALKPVNSVPDAPPSCSTIFRLWLINLRNVVLIVSPLCLALLLVSKHVDKPSGTGAPPLCRVHGVCEQRFRVDTPASGNPFSVPLHATFADGRGEQRVRGFYDGGGEYVVRFSPPRAGRWTWITDSTSAALQREGTLDAAVARASEHPLPVHTAGRRLVYADGSPHLSTGSTAYAWAHHNATTRNATLSTLRGAGAALNKLRFTIFPKWYVFNREEPQTGLYPFVGRAPSSWDFERFEPAFWRHFEGLVGELARLGVIADIILFHPYARPRSHACTLTL